jgi:hypothetical protein
LGVAAGATWIAAKGCEGSSCSRAALLASGQWILAPRDLNDLNADPTRAPHVVNNSTAINVSNVSCGGTPTNNNVWGNGRIDAFAATSAAP